MVIWLILPCAFACSLPDLPPSLSLFSPSFSTLGELSISSRFLSTPHDYSFTVTEESWIRVSATPKLHSLSIQLSSKNLATLETSAQAQQRASLSSKIPPDTYKLSIIPLESLSESDSNDIDCKIPNLYLSLSILPFEKLLQMKSKKFNQSYPDVSDAISAIVMSYEFSRTYEGASIPLDLIEAEVVASYSINVPDKVDFAQVFGVSGLWELTFSLHHEFATSGGLGIMLKKGKKPPKSINCGSGKCLLGRHNQKNTVTLYSVLTEGDYTISIYYDLNKDEMKMLKLIESVDFTLHLTVKPLIEREDRFNCDAATLPSDLNIFMDSAGFLKYFDWIFADFVIKKQTTRFEVFQPSVFRVTTIEPSGVDVDLLLSKNNERIAESNLVGGAEGILLELIPGIYTLDIAFVNSFIEDTRFKYCETVIVEIGVTPISAVESLISHYNLALCEDSSNIIDELFQDLTEKLLNDDVEYNPNEEYFTIPLKSLVVDETRIYKRDFEVKKDVFVYIEIFSDFVVNDLSISLTQTEGKKTNVVLGASDALEIGEHGRKSVAGELRPGRYHFVVRSAPTASISDDETEENKPFFVNEDYKTVPKCALFQLRIFFSSKPKSDWNCREVDFKLLPNTLNTIDRLGVKGTPQNYLHSAVFFSEAVAAPASGTIHVLNFSVESPSIIRLFAESEIGKMAFSLTVNGDTITSCGSEITQKPYIYAFTQELKRNLLYSIEVTYTSTSLKCHLYSLLIEITPKSRLESSPACTEIKPSEDFIQERLIELDALFDLISPDDSFNSDLSYQYTRSSSIYSFPLPLKITSESALITAHLVSNFIESGLILQISSDTEVLQWGRYKSPYRYELDPIALTSGAYSLTFSESSASFNSGCSKYSGILLMEDIGFWDNVSAMVRKSKTCTFPDETGTANIVGGLDRGVIFSHKVLPVDIMMQFNLIEFEVDEDSVVMVYVLPENNFDFSLAVSKYQNDKDLISGKSSMTGSLKPGKYVLSISYDFLFEAPNPKLCIGIETDISILTVNHYQKLFESNSCKKSQTLPNELIPTAYSSFLIYGQIDKYLKITLKDSSRINVHISYETPLSGYTHILLYSLDRRLLKRSIGDYNWNSLSADIPEGVYLIRIISDTPWQNACWLLTLSYSVSTSTACPGGILPPSLSSEDSKPYGGPQLADSSISFYGRFQVDALRPEQTLTITANSNSLVRILTITDGLFRTESAVYQKDVFDVPIAYSKNKSKFASYIFDLPKQTEPYYLILSHIITEPQACLTYELKIVIVPSSSVGEVIECNLDIKKSYLPKNFVEISKGSIVGGSDFAIFDKWMIGKELPEGVVSKGRIGTAFEYQVEVDLQMDGVLNVESGFDFLTNDIFIEVWRGKQQVAGSEWRVVAEEDGKVYSVINELELTQGKYMLRIRQGLASNHLLQRYQGLSVCFPFSFYLEFTNNYDVINPLTRISPPELQEHNSLTGLYLLLNFRNPIEVNEEIYENIYLFEDSKIIKPSDVTRDQDSSTGIRVKFSSSLLSKSTCYELKINSKYYQDDKIKHQYCTSDCKCNPKSTFACVDGACVCHPPYKGPECFGCIEDYELTKNTCLIINDNDPKIISVQFNIDKLLKKSQPLRLYVHLTSAPYLKEGEKISKINQDSLLNSFTLTTEGKEIKPFSALSLSQGDTNWSLKFASEDLEYGKIYRLKATPGLIFSSKGDPFAFPDIGNLGFEVDSKAEAAVCSGHGSEKGLVCICDDGYQGVDCNVCKKGFKVSGDGVCEKVSEDSETDNEAFIQNIIPEGLVFIVLGEKIIVDIELTVSPFTEKGYRVNSISNSKYIQRAFVLQKLRTDKYILSSSCKSNDSKGLKWTLEFYSKEYEITKTYELLQIDYVLYTEKNKIFAQTKLNLPKFKIFEPLDCGNGRQEQDKCICELPYQGKRCELCMSDYKKNIIGDCVIETEISHLNPPESSFFSTFLYILATLAIFGLVIFCISNLRQSEKHLKHEFELVRRNPPKSTEIDLYN